MQKQFLLSKIFWSIFLILGGWMSGQTSETFSKIPSENTATYIARTWTGDNGGTWNATSARTDQTLNSKAICTNNTGSVTSNIVAGGIGTLNFKYVRGFTGTSTRKLTVWVNDVKIGDDVIVSSTSNTAATYSQVVNISGNVQLEIRTSGAQIIIDDINWDGFSGCTPPSDPNGTISGNNNPCSNPTNLTYTSGSGQPETGISYYWQTAATGTSTTNSASSPLAVSANGTYYVRAYNTTTGCWSANSTTGFSVNFATPVSITTQPQNATVNTGVAATFSVTATNAVSYQWQISTNGGTTWTNISGETATSYTTPSATLAMNNYRYRVIVTNSCGDKISTGAILTVNQGPCIDEGFSGTTNSTPPVNWFFTGLGTHYASGGASGSPSLKFDSTGDQVITPSISPGTAQELSFWLKGNPSTGTSIDGSLLIEGYNGSSWVTVDLLANISNTAAVKTYNATSTPALAGGFIQFRFTFTKGNNGNLAFDDVKVICNQNTTVPVISISSNGAVSAGNINRNSISNFLTRFKLTVSGNTTILTGGNFNLAGTYTSADIQTNGLKLWYSATNDFSTATAVATWNSASTGSGETLTLPSTFSQFLPESTVYFWLTADIAANAVMGDTLNAQGLNSSNFTFYTGTKSGTVAAGGVQTIINSIPDAPANFTEICTTSTTQQLSWNTPEGGADGYLLVARQNGTPQAVTNIVAQSTTFNLNFAAAPTFGTPANSKILYSGTSTNVTVTGLTSGQNYTFAVYAYNANGTTSSVYSAVTTTSQTIGVSDVNFPVGNGGDAQATVSWQNPAGSCFEEVIAVVTTVSGINFTPTGSNYPANSYYTGGNQVVYSGTGNSVHITGLANGTTYYVEIFVRSGSVWSSGVEVAITPSNTTVFKPGELFFVGYDGQYLGTGTDDEYLIATLVDIKPQTEFSLVNSRYEAGALANVRTDKWGGSGDFAEGTPGVATIKYKGSSIIPAGSVLVLDTDGTNAVFDYYGVITNDVLTNRSSDFEAFLPYGTNTAPNISTSAPDQIFLVQGSFTDDGNIQTGEANYILNGTLLHGLSNRTAWVPLTSANSGGTAASNRTSRLPAALECFNLYYPASNTIVGYYKNDALHTGSFRQILTEINNPANWEYLTGNDMYFLDPATHDDLSAGRTFLYTPSSIPGGSWISTTNTVDGKDWFFCQNWENLTVPDDKTDVVIPSGTVISTLANTARAARYNGIAEARNLTINTGGTFNMSEPLSQLHLYGNWTNNAGETNYTEGGTVTFNGISAQIINQNNTSNPEIFHHVVMNNNFDTSVSNNLIANGTFTLNSGKIFTIGSNNYLKVTGNFTNNGNLTVQSDGNMIQTVDTSVYSGNNIAVKRNAVVPSDQYMYWSAPVDTQNLKTIYPNIPIALYYNEATDYFYFSNGTNIFGRGLAIKGATSGGPAVVANFIGKPYNANTYGTLTGINLTKNGQGYNLVGNPYPSNIDLKKLYQNVAGNNTLIHPNFYFWDNTSNTENQQQGSNYNQDSYAYYNASGSGMGTHAPNNTKIPTGIVTVGQGFMVQALHAGTLNFSNGIRTSDTGTFYNKTNADSGKYWLRLTTSQGNFIGIGIRYSEGATHDFENFDSEWRGNSDDMFYSVAEGHKLAIQGRNYPFMKEDKVELGTQFLQKGMHTISLEKAEGIFAGEQKIYLLDKDLNIYTDLQEGNYSFNAEAGSFTDRFEIVYKSGTAAVSDVNYQNILVYRDGEDIVIKSADKKISGVEVYEATGRLILKNTHRSNEIRLPAKNLSNGVYILKIDQEGTVISKKIRK